ncbi:VWA domain-containing protein [Occallatibacter riparius]|uniref:VWA domain-containing protein n=1 Tax=Occallatibacter riparius TaxID=1002689 RepID=A0A9J7BHY4_9BACT|nr:VWA domain-containing protein [Occallatibacter riparius]UWZ82067.1 VWA domain-containing protein [Occallatibacter riparius]
MRLHKSKLGSLRLKIALHVVFIALQIGSIALRSGGAQAQPNLNGRITLDVVVTDAAGKPVSSLQSRDFRIFEDGAERQIATFAGPDLHARAQNAPTQMIIVIDSLNNGFTEMGFMRQGLVRFLRENDGRLGQPTTIAQLTPSGMKILSQPSRDGNALANIVNGLGATVKPRGLDVLELSLNALVALATRETGVPGRKQLVWLGPGWATPLPPQGAFTKADVRDQRTYYAVAVQIAKLLRAARIVLYGGYSGGEYYRRDYLKPVKKLSDVDARALALNVLAIKSGGRGELPQTNRDSVVADMLDNFAAEANTFYSLSFDPPKHAANEYHEIRVAVNGAGLTARTIIGYYSEPENPSPEPAVRATAPEQSPSADEHTVRKFVTVAELIASLDALKGQSDAVAAREIEHLQLTERLSSAKFASLSSLMPGEKSKAALTALVDSSVFLMPPANEIPALAAPDLVAQRRIVSLAVNYLGQVVPKLPNFFARRTTVRFEGLQTVAKNGAAPQDHPPLRRANEETVTVLYRDGKEVVGNGRDKADARQTELVTRGIFGPVLSTVVVDASHGDMKWSHWETGPNGAMAVFAYNVSEAQSHYQVSSAALLNTSGSTAGFITAYHGEIGIDPASGTILRLALQADLAPGPPLDRADIMVEYGAVEIGSKDYICPLRSVSFSSEGSPAKNGGPAGTRYATRLNDVVFDNYHVFRSDMRIVPE